LQKKQSNGEVIFAAFLKYQVEIIYK